MKYLQRIEELKLTNKKHLPDLGDDNIEKIMYKIKSRVMKERMRLHEFFKDYDKLRTGRILKTLFPRAMDLSSLKLTKVEVQQLMDRWGSSPSQSLYLNLEKRSSQKNGQSDFFCPKVHVIRRMPIGTFLACAFGFPISHHVVLLWGIFSFYYFYLFIYCISQLQTKLLLLKRFLDTRIVFPICLFSVLDILRLDIQTTSTTQRLWKTLNQFSP